MPFIGKNPTSGFSTIVKDDLTPDGSTTAFTLSKNVASANDIAVFVGNVRQEPTDAYSVSGTTLTMTAAPASGLNFYVLHIAGTVESSVVPAAGTTVPGNFGASGQLSGGSGSFTGNVEITSGDSPLTLTNTNGSGYQQLGFNVGTQIGRIVFTGESFGDANYGTGDLTLQTQSSGGKIRFGTGAASTNKMIIDDSGIVSTPSQPSFWAYLGSSWTSWTPNDQTQIVPFDAEYHDIQGNFNTSNGLFTCPVDGNYVFSFSVYVGVQNVEQIWLVKNGVRQVTLGFANAGTSGDRSAANQILRCSAGDTIGVCPYGSSASTASIISNFHHTFFMGALVS